MLVYTRRYPNRLFDSTYLRLIIRMQKYLLNFKSAVYKNLQGMWLENLINTWCCWWFLGIFFRSWWKNAHKVRIFATLHNLFRSNIISITCVFEKVHSKYEYITFIHSFEKRIFSITFEIYTGIPLYSISRA